jgi:hypothetical protein
VGDSARLEAVLSRPDVQRLLSKPLHIVPQFRNLYENGWETFRRLLPGAPPEGRDPGPSDHDQRVLYVSGDLPFATPQEISEFVRLTLEAGCDYGCGLVTEASMVPFYPTAPGEPGIRMAYFNVREGRFRQSNLHLIKPAAIANRYYVEEMYEHRYQREFGSIASLAWRLMWTERGGFTVLWYFALMHLAGLADRRGWRGLADGVRSMIPIRRIERGCSSMIGGSFQFIPTGVGGCALDIDNDHDYDVALARYGEWSKAQRDRAERLHGPPALPPPPGAPIEIDVRRGDDG